ncbi:MAG: GtrA family protein [Halobacteriaceae archaeon]
MPSETSEGRVGALASRARFGKFVSVGAIGAVFDLSVSTVLSVGLGVPPEYAKLVGAEVAIVVMFAVNERWTFADHGLDGWPNALRRFLKSNLVRSGGLATQFLVVQFLSGLSVAVVVGGFDLWRVIPFPVAIAASMLLNYVFESLFTWRVHR